MCRAVVTLGIFYGIVFLLFLLLRWCKYLPVYCLLLEPNGRVPEPLSLFISVCPIDIHYSAQHNATHYSIFFCMA